MKMIKHIYLLLAALSIVACTQFDDNVLATNKVQLPDTIELSFEDSSNDTRVKISEYNQTCWTPGDAVSVFYRNTNNLKWQYDGDYETTHATLNYVSGDTGGQTSEVITILYPYNKDAYVDYSCRYIHTALPATQQYAKNSYGLNGNIMVASGNNTRFKLRSVCGWVRIAIAGADRKISSVSLRGNNGEILAGDIVIDANSAEYTLDNGGSTANKITLKCGDGLALQYAPVYLHIGVLPQTFSKGITVDIKYTNGSTSKLKTSSAMTIARNHVVPMECVDSDGNPISSSVPNNQIWYSATGYVDFERYDCGEATCLSNEFDEATGTGVAVFSNSIKSISGTAYSSGNLTSLLLPQSLQYIGDDAFKHCSQITNLVLNDGLESIGSEAFAYCSQLEQVRIPESVVEMGVNPFAGCENLSKFTGEHTSSDGHCLVMDGKLIAITPKASAAYTLSDNIREIGSYCLVGRSDIHELTLPRDLKYIADNAFSEASNLNRVNCMLDTPPAIGNSVFSSGTHIYVPMASFDEYVANNWHIYNLYGYNSETGETKCCWEPLGMGLYVDDFLAGLFNDTHLYQGLTTEVQFERYYFNENIIRTVNLFSMESLAAMWGGIPYEFIFTSTEHTYLTFDITDPNNVTLVGGESYNVSDGETITCVPLHLKIDNYDLALGQYITASTQPIKLVNGAIIFPSDGSIVLGALSDGMYLGYFYRANPTGNMALYLPGAE